MDKEYLMLRSEIEENLKKQDQLFGTVISILGLTNVFSHKLAECESQIAKSLNSNIGCFEIDHHSAA